MAGLQKGGAREHMAALSYCLARPSALGHLGASSLPRSGLAGHWAPPHMLTAPTRAGGAPAERTARAALSSRPATITDTRSPHLDSRATTVSLSIQGLWKEQMARPRGPVRARLWSSEGRGAGQTQARSTLTCCPLRSCLFPFFLFSYSQMRPRSSQEADLATPGSPRSGRAPTCRQETNEYASNWKVLSAAPFCCRGRPSSASGARGGREQAASDAGGRRVAVGGGRRASVTVTATGTGVEVQQQPPAAADGAGLSAVRSLRLRTCTHAPRPLPSPG